MHFRVWAPEQPSLSVVIEDGDEVELEREEHGYFSILVPGLSAGARYRFRIGNDLFPDPASRFQPEGPHGPSMVVDPATFAWREWHGIEPKVLYEMHVQPVLETLRTDPKLYVKKSVANVLRNASGKHPELVLSICRHWSRSSNPHTGWIVKEGLRKLKSSRRRDVVAILETLELSA